MCFNYKCPITILVEVTEESRMPLNSRYDFLLKIKYHFLKVF